MSVRRFSRQDSLSDVCSVAGAKDTSSVCRMSLKSAFLEFSPPAVTLVYKLYLICSLSSYVGCLPVVWYMSGSLEQMSISWGQTNTCILYGRENIQRSTTIHRSKVFKTTQTLHFFARFFFRQSFFSLQKTHKTGPEGPIDIQIVHIVIILTVPLLDAKTLLRRTSAHHSTSQHIKAHN